MLTISTKGRYGSRLMMELALHYGKGPLLLRTIAKRQEISEGYFEQIVMLLKSAGLVHASRGSRGGYVLAKPPAEITMKDIIFALEGRISLVECVQNPGICKRRSSCATRIVWNKLTETMITMLESFTLASLVAQQRDAGEHALSFVI